MFFLTKGHQRHALPVGATKLGTAAVIECAASGAPTIRALDGVAVTVGGTRLGTAPRPLRDGDRIEIGGVQLVFGATAAAGPEADRNKTTVIAGMTSTERAALESATGGEATATTGGRLITADGREHRVPDEGLAIGRDSTCGLVLSSKQVSRQHAIIAPTLLGYAITDRSVNGVLVNGVRIDGSQRLGRGDVVRIGEDDLRFDADDTSFEPAPLDQSQLAVLPALDLSRLGATAEQVTSRPTIETAASTRPAAPVAPTLLATLEVLTDGVLKGTRFRIERPVAQLGRSGHNDVQLSDPSVSGTHATLLQRAGHWHLLDLGSRNGSYIDGERVVDHPLGGACEIRLGNIKLLFRAIAATAADTKGTVGIVGLTDAEVEKYKPR